MLLGPLGPAKEHLRSRLAVSALVALAEAAPKPRSLELKFWKLFAAHGFHPQKQVPVAQTDGEAAISIADFAVPEERLAIYVDGAALHAGANLRRDRSIQERLRSGSPRGRVGLKAKDLREEAGLVKSLVV